MNDTAMIALTQTAMPALSMQQAMDRHNQLMAYVKQALVVDTDFGVIPGTGSKPTLLKPGAEKLCTFFGLRPTFETVKATEDWTGREFDGEPFFFYWMRCRLVRNGEIMAEGDGACSSRESKYRYRQGERKCPQCGKPTIIKGRQEYGGGWLCYGKKGGCGAKFAAGDKSIEGQEVGRIINPDVADQQNTILKMAQKRALVAATLIGVNASQFFTQDVEDMPEWSGETVESVARTVEPTRLPSQPTGQSDKDWQETVAGAPSPVASTPPTTNGKPKLRPASIATPAFFKAAEDLAADEDYYRKDGKADTQHMVRSAAKLGYADITADNLADVMLALRQHAAEQKALPQEQPA